MARGRMLNKKVSRSRQIDLLPDDTCRLMATWTIAHLDVNGVFYADPTMVCSLIFPRRTDISVEQVECYLDAMEQVGLIERYENGGEMWQWWPAFLENQIGLRADRERPQYPSPPVCEAETVSGDADFSGEDAGYMPESIRHDDGKLPAEEKLSEVKVKLSEEKAPQAAGANAPSRTPPKAQKRTKQKKPTPAAVKAFRAAAARYPAKSWYDEVASTVGEEQCNLDRWHAVVFKWVGLGWKPTNVSGMLECFRENRMPGDGGRNDGRTKPVEQVVQATGLGETITADNAGPGGRPLTEAERNAMGIRPQHQARDGPPG